MILIHKQGFFINFSPASFPLTFTMIFLIFNNDVKNRVAVWETMRLFLWILCYIFTRMNPLTRFLTEARENIYEIFGVHNGMELLQTVVLLKYFKVSLLLSISFVSLDQFIKMWTGVHLDVYLLFVTGIFMDTVMSFYIVLFVRTDTPFSKYKIIGKSLFKVVVYSFLMVILHRFNLSFNDFKILSIKIDVFDWLYKLVVTFIFIQLVLGLLQKANDAGFEEMKGLMDLINRKLGKPLNNARIKTKEKGDKTTPPTEE